MSIQVHNLEEWGTTLTQYQAAGQKTVAEAVAKANNSIRIELYRTFRDAAPDRGYISQIAKQRQYALSVGPVAKRLAANYMEGSKAIAGNVYDQGGMLMIRSVRVGKKGKRVTGGRKGRGGRAATWSETQAMRRDGEKTMGTRAVQVFFEMMLRNRGRQSAAVSFLNKKYKMLSLKDWQSEGFGGGTRKRLVQVNPKAEVEVMGENDFEVTNDAAFANIRFNFQSSQGINRHRGDVGSAINRARADMLDYIRRKQVEAIQGKSISKKNWESGAYDTFRNS